MRWGLSLLTILTLGAAFLVISLVLDHYREHQFDVSLLEIARAEADEAPANHFSFSTRQGPASNDVGPLDNYGLIFGETGEVLAATRPFDKTPPDLATFTTPLRTPFDFTFSGQHYRGVLVGVPNFPRHRLLLAASREDLDGESHFVRKEIGIAFVVSVVWLLAAIDWIIRRSMREHARIAETLHRIATGDVDARVSGEFSDQELRRMGSDIDEITDRLAHLIGHQRRFIAHAAHELRSPLAALHGEIQQALRKERSPEEYRASYVFLLRASERLKHLADELLELARSEDRSKNPEPVSLAVALNDVIDSLEPLAKEKKVRIDRVKSDLVVRAVMRDVERIFRNLLDNAIRHSPESGTVTIELEPGKTIRIRVRDEGTGVPADATATIFEPFHRLPIARTEARGAGLGLSIARELARKHHGDIVVGPELNCFEVTLPRQAASE